MMQKTAVLFVLITALVFAGIFTGCSSNETGGSGQSGISGSADGAGQNDSPGKTGASSQTGSSETADNSGKVDSSSQTNAQDSSKIPDTNESAVSDWGVADAPDNTHNVETENSNAGTDVSRIIVDRDDLLFAVKEVKADAALGYTWKVYIENRTDKQLIVTNDLLVVASASGESKLPVALAKIAHNLGVTIAYVGCTPGSTVDSLANLRVIVPGRTKFAGPNNYPSLQPMSTLFEQELYLLGDVIALCIMEHNGWNEDSIKDRHANLE